MATKKTYVKVINMKTLGRAGGKKRAETLTSKQLRAAAIAANKVRWDNYYAANPDRTRPVKRKAAAK